jgi:L-ascorbate metabolism protein UlaG (beta-lactamase superfamily)
MEIGKDLVLLGHSAFLLKHEGKNIYIDPFMLKGSLPKADLILITHAHYDHCSPADIDKIIRDGTKIICSKLCKGLEAYKDVSVMGPFESRSELGLKIETTRAYNTKKERLQFHPKSNDWLGYVIEADSRKIYHAGDTDFIPEMRQLEGLYVALLPMGDTYTMEVDEMIEAARAIDSEHVAPIHYRLLLGDRAEEAERKLKSSLKNAIILKDAVP